MKSQFKDQVGGTHYSSLAIQPVEYITKNKLDWHEGNIVKYVTRHKLKGGAQDLKKVVHYALLELEQQYGIKAEVKYDDEKQNKASHKRIRRVRRPAGPRVQGVQGIFNTNDFLTTVNLPAETPNPT